MGLSEEDVQQALDHYRAKAAQNAYAGVRREVLRVGEKGRFAEEEEEESWFRTL